MNVTPFLRVGGSCLAEDRFIKRLDFSAKIVEMNLLRNKIIAAEVEWGCSCAAINHTIKFAVVGCQTSTTFENGDWSSSVDLAFPLQKYRSRIRRWPIQIEVGLRSRKPRYRYMFFENTGFGAIVYFAPDGFLSFTKSTPIRFDTTV